MFDTATRTSVSSHHHPPILQFVSFEVSPTSGGFLRVSLSCTYLDEALWNSSMRTSRPHASQHSRKWFR